MKVNRQFQLTFLGSCNHIISISKKHIPNKEIIVRQSTKENDAQAQTPLR